MLVFLNRSLEDLSLDFCSLQIDFEVSSSGQLSSAVRASLHKVFGLFQLLGIRFDCQLQIRQADSQQDSDTTQKWNRIPFSCGFVLLFR